MNSSVTPTANTARSTTGSNDNTVNIRYPIVTREDGQSCGQSMLSHIRVRNDRENNNNTNGRHDEANLNGCLGTEWRFLW